MDDQTIDGYIGFLNKLDGELIELNRSIINAKEAIYRLRELSATMRENTIPISKH